MNVWPLALSSAEHAASGRLRRRLQRSAQGYLFWPLTFLLAFAMRVESWRHVVARVQARRVDRALVADVACLLAHYALWLVLPMAWFGFLPVLLVYAGLWATSGFLLALVFAPAHIGLPLGETDSRAGWQQQIDHTRNFRLPRWISWFFVGLDFQIEHHLFPRIPHQNLACASRIVEPWCARVGVLYRRVDYATSVRDVTRHVRLSWQTVPEVAVEHPEALETLTVGSRVFYPGHGVSRVVCREDREFGGATQSYYVLELEGDRHARLMVPVGRVMDAGIRALVSASKARELIKSIGDAAEPGERKTDPASRKVRATGYNEALRSGSPDRYTNTVRELLARFRSGKLSPAEQLSLNQALGMLLGEVSAALGRTVEDVRAELCSIAELPATGWW
jgi:RNA polymerase-interacting CarD/CdnL/TRCF family regulator